VFALVPVARGLALTLCLAQAQAPPPRPDPPADERAILVLYVNDIARGEAFVVLRRPDVLVRAADLESARVPLGTAMRLDIDGVSYITLASLAPAVTYTLDERALELRLTLGAQAFPASTIRTSSLAPANVEYLRAPSAFLNYATTWRSNGADVTAELGATLGPTLVSGTLFRRPGGGFGRGLTSLTLDERTRMRRWIVGDRITSTGTLGSTTIVGGVGLRRAFELDPYFVRYPTRTLTGALTTPSTVEVYVNGRLVEQQHLPAGVFSLEGLTTPVGAGDTRVVVRDAFGRETQASASFYQTSSALARGLQEYDYGIGLLRDGTSDRLGTYAEPALLARHRLGVTDRLTLGYRLEATDRLVSGGPDMAVATPFGDLNAGFGASRRGAATSVASYVGFDYTARRVSTGISAVSFGRTYATADLGPQMDRPRLDARAYVSVQLARFGYLGLEAGASDYWQRPTRARAALTLRARVARRADAMLTAARTMESGRGQWQALLGLSIALDSHTSAFLTFDRQAGASRHSYEVQRGTPQGPGIGYRLHADAGDRNRAEGRFVAQGRHGRVEFEQVTMDGQPARTAATVAGGIVAIGGGIFATRPVTDAFALVRVPGVEGVRTFASNQEIGRTGRGGRVIVPDLLSNYANRLAIAPDDIPFEREAPAGPRLVAPPYRGGAIVNFDAPVVRSLYGRLVIDTGGALVPAAFGELRVRAGAREARSPLGKYGEFYLEDLPEGRWSAVAVGLPRECRAVLIVPASKDGFIDAGTVICRVGEQ
jgi:outer membrane usher protein